MFSIAQNTQRFTELGKEEKGEGGDRGDLVEKKESQKGERLFLCMVLESVLVSFFWGWCTGTTQREGMGREEGDRGDPNEMRWNQKRREQASQ